MGVPKVSVVIPNYNHAQYLEQRIESVLDQSFTDFEIIILDDNSTDNSLEIIDKYASHEKVSTILFNDKNSGNPFRQWQRGVSRARGEWIWLAESDDYADRYFLEKMIGAIGKNTNIGLAYCDSNVVSQNVVSAETFAQIKGKRFKTDRWNHDYENSGVDEIEDYVLPGGTINNTSAVLFKRQIFQQADPFDISLRYIGDKYAFVKVLAISDVVYVSEALNYFRDPFNSKHIDKFVYYFYEQFLVFDWAYRNIHISNREKFFRGFYANTRNSLFRNWNGAKILLYGKLLKRNPYLLLKSVLHNFREAFRTS
jgi:glycosyltransferase involved in cell wall biosynthesis